MKRMQGVLVWVVLLLLALPRSTLAVSEGAPSVYYPLLIGSARASGMGAMTVILDDGDIAALSNPGFLPLDDQWRVGVFRSKLVPALADDIWLGGLQFTGAIRGNPVVFDRALAVGFALGYTRLSYGEWTVMTEDGWPVATVHSYDRALSATLAFGIADLAGFGLSLEHVKSKLTDPIPELDISDGTGTATSVSLGIGIGPRFVLSQNASEGVRISATPLIGISYLHRGSDIAYNDEDQAEVLPRQLRAGIGFRMALEPVAPPRFLLDPVRLKQAELTAGGQVTLPRVNEDDEPIWHAGMEVCALGLASFRVGYIEDKDGDVKGWTYGVGLGVERILPLGLRIDYASVPQASDLDRVNRWGLVASLDPTFLSDL